MEKYMRDAFDKVEVSAERVKSNVREALAEGASAKSGASKWRAGPRVYRKVMVVAAAVVLTLSMGTTALGIDIGVNAPLLKLLNIDSYDEKRLADESSIPIDKNAISKNIDVNVSEVVGDGHLIYVVFNADLSGLPEYTDDGKERLHYRFSEVSLVRGPNDENGWLSINSTTYQIESDEGDGRTWFAFEGRSLENLKGRDVTLSLGPLWGMKKSVVEGEEQFRTALTVEGDWDVDLTLNFRNDSLALGGGKAKAEPPVGYEVSTSDLIISDVLLSPISLSFDVAGDGRDLEVIPPEGYDGGALPPESRPDKESYIWQYLPVTATMKDGTAVDLWAELDTEYKGDGVAEIPEASDFMTAYSPDGEVNSQDSHMLKVIIKFKNFTDTSDFESITIGGLRLAV